MTTDPLDALRLPIVPIAPRPEFAEALLRRLEARGAAPREESATVRYYVDDLDAAVAFYRDDLGFDEELVARPSFAMLYRGDLRLLLSVPDERHVLADGTRPRPGGWNRISLLVRDLTGTVGVLRGRGLRFRTDVVTGVGVRQVVLEDPAGNLVELFEPAAGYHERATAPRPGEERP